MAQSLFGTSDTKPDFSFLPKPLQDAYARARLVRGEPFGQAIATVENWSTDTITIRDPNRMRPQVFGHEITHLWQNALQPSIYDKFPKAKEGSEYLDIEAMQALPRMRNNGMTLKDMPEEHQAQIIQAYINYHDNPAWKGILQPWVNDVNDIQKESDLARILKTPLIQAVYKASKGM